MIVKYAGLIVLWVAAAVVSGVIGFVMYDPGRSPNGEFQPFVFAAMLVPMAAALYVTVQRFRRR